MTEDEPVTGAIRDPRGAALLTPDWLLGPIAVTSAGAEALLKAARWADHALSGDTDDREARLARTLADQGLLRWVTDGRWPKGSWLAYLTCPGWNALWRWFNDFHIDHCGDVWLPDGTCSGCRALRRLDRPAWRARLAALDPDERAAETAHSALWCPEHGYLRAKDRTTTKVCLLPGTPLHDGNLNRVSP